VKIKILYNNTTKLGFKSAWGFSCLIEAKEKILFDSGWDGDLLLYNMKKFGFNPEEIDKILISHDHWDHAGGISRILNKTKNPDVFVLKSFSQHLKKEIGKRAIVHEVSKMEEISEKIFTTGPLGTEIKEQSIFIETENGFIVITGCAHPGVNNIIDFVKKFGKVYWVMGGFHDFSDIEYLKDIPVISSCHCTMHIKEIIEKYPEKYKECLAGSEFVI